MIRIDVWHRTSAKTWYYCKRRRKRCVRSIVLRYLVVIYRKDIVLRIEGSNNLIAMMISLDLSLYYNDKETGEVREWIWCISTAILSIWCLCAKARQKRRRQDTISEDQRLDDSSDISLHEWTRDSTRPCSRQACLVFLSGTTLDHCLTILTQQTLSDIQHFHVNGRSLEPSLSIVGKDHALPWLPARYDC
jgi:hypothetical protein